jgi:hypothetical protein
LSFDGIVADANGGGIIAMDGSFRLQMSHDGEGLSKNNSILAIMEESSQFGFRGRGDNEF